MISQALLIILYAILTSLSPEIRAETADARHDLYDDLFLDYDSRVLPKKRPHHAVNVTMSVKFLYIHKLTLIESEIEISLQLFQQWSDFRLRWKPKDYDGLRSMAVKKQDIWQPDITLLNSVHGVTNNINNVVEFAQLTSHGAITSVSSLTVRASCEPRPENETQSCDFRFGSWVYPEKELYVKFAGTKNETTATAFESVVSPVWILDPLMSTIDRQLVKYDCCSDRFAQIFVKMYLDRK